MYHCMIKLFQCIDCLDYMQTTVVFSFLYNLVNKSQKEG